MSEQSSEDGVTVPEEFQKKVHDLVKGASKHHLNHMSDRISARHDELRKEETKKTGKGGTPSEYSTEGMPG